MLKEPKLAAPRNGERVRSAQHEGIFEVVFVNASIPHDYWCACARVVSAKDYSCLSATMGSTFMARRAGR
jgi:hypothetical protein